MDYPPLPSNIGKRGSLIHPPDGHKTHFTITDEIQRVQTDFPEKVICLQRIRFDYNVDEIRVAYYIIGKKPKMLGRWVWGQYATMMPLEDFKWIIQHAKEKGWF